MNFYEQKQRKKEGVNMNDLKKRLANLLTIKSLVTLILTILFSVLAFIGNIPEEVSSVFYTVIGFYFGTQAKKD